MSDFETMRALMHKPPGRWELSIDAHDAEQWAARDLRGGGRGASAPLRCAASGLTAPRAITLDPLEAAVCRLALAKAVHPRLGALEWPIDVEERVGRLLTSPLLRPGGLWPTVETEDGEDPDPDSECTAPPWAGRAGSAGLVELATDNPTMALAEARQFARTNLKRDEDQQCNCRRCLMQDIAVVIDVGSANTRVGFAGEARVSVFPSVVVRRRPVQAVQEQALEPDSEPEPAEVVPPPTAVLEVVAVGDAALGIQGHAQLELVGVGQQAPSARHQPNIYIGSNMPAIVSNMPATKRQTVYGDIWPGMSTDWDAFEALCLHSYQAVLCTDPVAHPLLLTEPPLNAKAHRERLITLAFEKLRVPFFYVQNTTVLALYASGSSTGTVIEIGASGTCISSVYEGYLISHETRQNGVGGWAIGTCVLPALERAGCIFANPRHQVDCCADVVQALGTTRTHVDLSDGTDTPSVSGGIFRLRRGMGGGYVDITLTAAERLACGEVLFEPKLLKVTSEEKGLVQLLAGAMDVVDINNIRDHWAHVVLTGGASAIPNLMTRLQAEITRTDDDRVVRNTTWKKKIVRADHFERQHGAFIGGCILAALSTVSYTRCIPLVHRS